MRRVDWFPLTFSMTLVQADIGSPVGFILTQDPTPFRISSGHRQNGLAILTEFLRLSGRYSATYFSRLHAAAAKSLQSCLTLCDPIDSSPPGSPVPGILQARTLEWVAISFSNA